MKHLLLNFAFVAILAFVNCDDGEKKGPKVTDKVSY